MFLARLAGKDPHVHQAGCKDVALAIHDFYAGRDAGPEKVAAEIKYLAVLNQHRAMYVEA
ncbi:hypothetical protein GCM10011587_13830 [Pyruvatibacter mobilis]|nr:hypothetical protein GCM10011587_13830 [Pyruvatibacter mobilis]